MKLKSVSRRKFLAGAAAAGASIAQACTIVPRHVLGGAGFVAPSEKLNVGVIGCGGKGFEDLTGVSTENIVALCDVDARRADRGFKAQPRAKRYTDFRRMLDEEKSLDAVTISTPDHTHAVATSMAIRRGLHVYTQKPLTRTILEGRHLQKLARRYGVVTQMGNQGTSLDGLRQGVEIVQSGALGPVREVHVWSDRPFWPQGVERPSGGGGPPPTMDWDLWLSVAPQRPYDKSYAPFNWRGWFDWGTGALGDMACHTANLPFMALKLDETHPTRVEARTAERFPETFPSWSIVKFEFPARGEMSPLEFTWYDGGKYPPREKFPELEFKGSGILIVGDKGMLFSGDYNGTPFKLLPEEDFEGYEPPTPWLPRVPTPQKNVLPQLPMHYQEWINACKGEGKTLSNFDYAVPLTEITLVGNIAIRVGHPVDWDGARMRFGGCEAANRLLHSEYREGYSL